MPGSTHWFLDTSNPCGECRELCDCVLYLVEATRAACPASTLALNRDPPATSRYKSVTSDSSQTPTRSVPRTPYTSRNRHIFSDPSRPFCRKLCTAVVRPSVITMRASPLLVRWHDENAPIYSSAFEAGPKGRLATAGGDNNVRVSRRSGSLVGLSMLTSASSGRSRAMEKTGRSHICQHWQSTARP